MNLIEQIKQGYALKHQERLTSKDIADMLGVSLTTVARWSATGHIPPVGVGLLRESYGQYLAAELAAPGRMPTWLIAEAPGDDDHYFVIRTGAPSAIIKIREHDNGGLQVVATELHGDPAAAAAIEEEAVERLTAWIIEAEADDE